MDLGVIVSPYSSLGLALILVFIILGLKKKMYMVQSLLLANGAVFFLLFLYRTILPLNDYMLIHFDHVFWAEGIVAGSHPYGSILLSMFTHFDPLHIIFNMVFLLILGTPFEERVGSKRFLLIYLVSGLGAELVFSLFSFSTPVIGASGAIAGIIGAFAALYPRYEVFMPVVVILMRVKVIYGAMIYLATQIFWTMMPGNPGIAYTAHLGGFFFGLFMAPLITKKRDWSPKEPDFSALKELANGKELQTILKRIEKEDEPEVRKAWLEEFANKNICPQCISKMKLVGNSIECSNGHRYRF